MAIRYEGIEFDTIDELLDYRRRAGENAPLPVKETKPKPVKKYIKSKDKLRLRKELSRLSTLDERKRFLEEESKRTGKGMTTLLSQMYKQIKSGKLKMHSWVSPSVACEPLSQEEKEDSDQPMTAPAVSTRNPLQNKSKWYTKEERSKIRAAVIKDGNKLVSTTLRELAKEMQRPYPALKWQAWSILQAEKRSLAKPLIEGKPETAAEPVSETQLESEKEVKPGLPSREHMIKYMTRRKPYLPEDFVKKRLTLANGAVTEEIPEWSDIYPLTHESQKPLIDLVRFTIGSKGRIGYRDLQFTTTLVGEKVWSGREWHGFIEQFMHQGKRILAYFGARGRFIVEIEHGFEYIKYEGERK